MNKHKISTIFIIITVFGWAFSLALIFPEHVSKLMALAILFPMIPATIVIWIQSKTVPTNLLRQINEIAIKIDHDLETQRTALDTEGVPSEILPLINAINRLLRHQNDRYLQERDFSAHASHELRTPMAGIRLQTELAMMTNDKNKRNKAMRNIIASVDRGTRLIEQLLTISRLTVENIDLATENVDILKLAKQVVEENQQKAKAKQITLSFKTDIDNLLVEGSEQSLRILMDNLLRNAINYTQQQGEIYLYASKDLQHSIATIIVNDNGPGIPEQMRLRVLERFEKAGNSNGSGLGLAIVKRIVELHSGKITLLTGDNQQGVKIQVNIPKVHIF